MLPGLQLEAWHVQLHVHLLPRAACSDLLMDDLTLLKCRCLGSERRRLGFCQSADSEQRMPCMGPPQDSAAFQSTRLMHGWLPQEGQHATADQAEPSQAAAKADVLEGQAETAVTAAADSPVETEVTLHHVYVPALRLPSC